LQNQLLNKANFKVFGVLQKHMTSLNEQSAEDAPESYHEGIAQLTEGFS
jgi:hypothetical protein